MIAVHTFTTWGRRHSRLLSTSVIAGFSAVKSEVNPNPTFLLKSITAY